MTPIQVKNGAVDLAVRIWGDQTSKPTLLFVHGFPDNSLVWEGLASRLQDQFRVVAYDVRGAGQSTAPQRIRDYQLSELISDLGAVIEAVSPDEPVHIIGHDWGSIQCWEAATTPRFHDRIASFTSISGPSLDHAAFWLNRALRNGSPKDRQKAIRQLLHSWYIFSFHLPLVPRLSWRIAFNKWPSALTRYVPKLEQEIFASQARDGLNGIRLYRANFVPRLLKPTARWTDVPIQLIVPTEDSFVTAGLFDDLASWAPLLWRRDVVASHWVQLSHPDLIANHIREFVQFCEGQPATLALQQARVAPQ